MTGTFDPLAAIDAWLDNELDAQQQQGLRDWLEADTAHAAVLAQRAFLHTRLRQLHGYPFGAPEMLVEPGSASVELAPTIWRRTIPAIRQVASNYLALSLLVSALVMVNLLLSMALIVPDWERAEPVVESPDITFVARITTTHNATWDKSSDGNFKNRELFAGERLVLNSGLTEITFGDGAVVLLEGPAELIVDTANTATFHLGKLVGRVPPSAIGFTIDTPVMRIVDLGTEFAVEVSGEDAAEVHVLTGAVAVCPPDGPLDSDANNRTILTAGEAIRVDSQNPVGVKVSPRKFARTVPGRKAPTGRFIGINFTANDAPKFTGRVAEQTKLGVVGAGQWNDVGPRGGSQSDRDLLPDVLAPRAGALVDSEGKATKGLTARYGYSNANRNKVASQLFHAGLNANDTLSNIQVAVTGIPYANYDVYVFVSDRLAPGVSGRFVKQVRLGDVTYFFHRSGPEGTRWITSTNPEQPTTGGNIVAFRGLSGPSMQLDMSGAVHAKSLLFCHGIQIVEVAGKAQ